MKVIIEVNGNVSIENNECDSEVTIWFNRYDPNKKLQADSWSYTVNIDDLKLALRKMTAK